MLATSRIHHRIGSQVCFRAHIFKTFPGPSRSIVVNKDASGKSPRLCGDSVQEANIFTLPAPSRPVVMRKDTSDISPSLCGTAYGGGPLGYFAMLSLLLSASTKAAATDKDRRCGSVWNCTLCALGASGLINDGRCVGSML